MALADTRRAVAARVDEYFEISARGSSYAQELRGGLATFLTMSYILLVNPQILTTWLVVNSAHNDLADVKDDFSKGIATSTALVCGLGCIVVGIASRMPFAIGPGMGLNTFVAGLFLQARTYADLDDAREAWSMVATSTFLAGVVLTLLSALGAISPIITALPETIKTAIMVGIGAYQAFIGFREMGILAPASAVDIIALEDAPTFDWDTRGDVTSGYAQVLFLISLVITTVLFARQIKGSILVGIAFCTVLCWAMGVGGGGIPNPPVAVPDVSNNTFGTVDFDAFFQVKKNVSKYLPQVFVMLLITIFDCGGVQFGVAKLLNLPEKYRNNGKDRRQRRSLRPQISNVPGRRVDGIPQVSSVWIDDVAPGGDVTDVEDSDISGTVADEATYEPRRSVTNPAIGIQLEKDMELKRLEQQLRTMEQLERDGVKDLTGPRQQVQKKLDYIKSGHLPSAFHRKTSRVGADGLETDSAAAAAAAAAVAAAGEKLVLLPRRTAQFTFVCVGVMDMVAGLCGASPCIVFLECAAGVEEGASTGLASVITGVFFLVTMFLAPIFQSVPLAASAGPLVFIGCLMMGHVGEIRWHDITHALPAFFTILLMPFTSSITPGIVSGLVMYIALQGLQKAGDRLSAAVCAPALHKAARKGDLEAVMILLGDATMDVNAVDARGRTALHYAVWQGDNRIIRAVIDAGGDSGVQDKDGVAPRDIM